MNNICINNFIKHTQIPSYFRQHVTLTVRLKYYMDVLTYYVVSFLEAVTENKLRYSIANMADIHSC
jgi:hypothetical protein